MTRQTFFCIDGHTAGMPVRMVVGGAPALEGRDAAQRRQHFVAEFDWIRRALTMEPRGHAFMSGTLLYPAPSDEADMALVFIETSGSLPMCGHATIGSVTFALEHGLVQPREPGLVRVETPAGLVEARYRMDGSKVASVRFTNVPSFLLHRDVWIDVPDLGRLKIDVAYGGNFYAIVEPQAGFAGPKDYTPDQLLRYGREVQAAVNRAVPIAHPLMPEINRLRHCLWSGPAERDGADASIVVIAGDHLIDRSPCGTGTSARVAQRVARGLMGIGDQFVHASLTGGCFIGRAEAMCDVGGLAAVRPSVEGQAWVTGLNTLFVDDDEPFADGFLIG